MNDKNLAMDDLNSELPLTDEQYRGQPILPPQTKGHRGTQRYIQLRTLLLLHQG